MAGKGRKMTLESLEAKILKQEDAVKNAKNRYEKAKAELTKLTLMRDKMQTSDLMDAIAKSKVSIPDVIKMVNEKAFKK